MKPITYSILAAALASGLASAQTAYTTPVGYTTKSLSQGFNLLGLTVHSPTVAAGDFELTAPFGNVLTDSDITFAPVSGRTYVLEITSGAIAGSVIEVPAASISGSSITVSLAPSTAEALGVVDGDKYKLRLAPTLEEVFTTVPFANGGVLKAAINAASSDNIWVPNGAGGYDKYFLRSGATPAFQLITGATTFVAAPNVPVIYSDGLLVQKRDAGSVNLVNSGEVKTTGSNAVIIQGFNLVSIVAPSGLTLKTLGIEDDLKGALAVNSADWVWVQQANLTYKKYWRRGTVVATATWRDVDAPLVDLAGDPVLEGAVLIQRRDAGAVNVDMNVPASYSSL